MKRTITDIYDDYKEDGGEIDRSTFSSLCNEFNQKVMDEIVLQGGTFNQGQWLSTIDIIKVPRNYKRKQVNWKASNERKEELLKEGKELYDSDSGEGHKWLVYYTDPWYCRFHWDKYGCSVPNRTKYQFQPTRGRVGNKTKLKELLNNNKTAHLRFKKAKTKR